MAGIRKLKRNGELKHSEKRTAVTSAVGNLTFKEMHRRFMQYKRSEGLSFRTLDDYEIHFGYLIDYFGGDLSKKEMTTDTFLGYKNYLIYDKGYKPNTVNVRVRTLHAFLKFCYEEGYIIKPIHNKIKTVKAPIDNLEALTPQEIKALLAVLNDDWFTQYRDKIIILILLDTMARISELLDVKRENIDTNGGSIYLEGSTVKTRQGRTLPLSYKTAKLLADYLQETADFNTEYVFTTYDGKRLQGDTFRKRLTEYGKLADIKGTVHPHKLRHTGALLYLLNGGEPFSLQKILGHKDMTMTRRYVQMTNANVKSQHEQFSPLNSIFKK